MRTNLPVTQQEHAYSPRHSLVSVTDLKGRITYCNDAFVAVSGYSREELLGQPHNIIRHPDMPEEAFRDMWHTLQQGYPWTGLVKNRRKNGDHYWVLANATPMKDGDRIVGYLSVRVQPERGAVQAAEKLYASMQEEARAQANGHALRTVLAHGQVRQNTRVARFMRMITPGLRGKLIALQVLSAASCLLSAHFFHPAIAVVLAILAISLTLVLIHKLTIAPLQTIVDDANRLAAGDLAHPIRTGESGMVGEVQTALNQMAVNLRTIVIDTRTELDHVRQSVSEISAGNTDLSARTEAQASSLEQTASSMHEINSTIRQTAESARHGTTLADETGAIAKRSHEAVQQVANSMETIKDSSHRIGEIIHVVESVAFQTNILALNAAVEAARAGEAGRGFAVVASEVRALAQRTTAAAREIKNLVTESAERVAVGNQHSSHAQESMNLALQSVHNVTSLLGEISTAAHEQQQGIEQISQAVVHMDGITQQNASLVEQLAASAKALLAQVETVSNSMRMFRLQKGESTVAEVDAVALRKAAKGEPPRLGARHRAE